MRAFACAWNDQIVPGFVSLLPSSYPWSVLIILSVSSFLLFLEKKRASLQRKCDKSCENVVHHSDRPMQGNPRQSWILDSTQRIPDFLSCIPDFKPSNSGFHNFHNDFSNMCVWFLFRPAQGGNIPIPQCFSVFRQLRCSWSWKCKQNGDSKVTRIFQE